MISHSRPPGPAIVEPAAFWRSRNPVPASEAGGHLGPARDGLRPGSARRPRRRGGSDIAGARGQVESRPGDIVEVEAGLAGVGRRLGPAFPDGPPARSPCPPGARAVTEATRQSEPKSSAMTKRGQRDVAQRRRDRGPTGADRARRARAADARAAIRARWACQTASEAGSAAPMACVSVRAAIGRPGSVASSRVERLGAGRPAEAAQPGDEQSRGPRPQRPAGRSRPPRSGQDILQRQRPVPQA